MATGKTVTFSAKAAGYRLRHVYSRREADEEFAKQWTEAYEAGTAAYEDEMHRRAVEGVDRPIYQNGKKVGVVRDYSDNLLHVALKMRAPERYRENVNVSGAVDHKHTHEFVLRAANQRAMDNLAKLRAGTEPKVIEHV